jgi:hypothetical protein
LPFPGIHIYFCPFTGSYNRIAWKNRRGAIKFGRNQSNLERDMQGKKSHKTDPIKQIP